MLKRIVFLLITAFTCIINNTWASHSMGLDLTYTCISLNTYQLKLTFYRDCDGIEAPGLGGRDLPKITIASASCGESFTQEFKLIEWQEAKAVCSSLVTTCSGGNYPSLEEYVYESTVILPLACSDWVFSSGLCCRNDAINRIEVTKVDIYVEAKLDNVTAVCNNSPDFSITPVPFICVGSSYCFNNGASDIDGDSLAYKLVPPTTGPGGSDTVDYVAGYSATSPVKSSPNLSLDEITGDICLNPTALEVSVLQIRIEEWRDGVLIGMIDRDIQIRVIDCIVANSLPEINGIDTSGIYTASICAGDTYCFFTEAIDADVGNVVTMTADDGIPDATFTVTSDDLPVGTFCWKPKLSDVRSIPHCFTVSVKDNNCPFLGSQVFSFCITVTSYFSSEVSSFSNVSCV